MEKSIETPTTGKTMVVVVFTIASLMFFLFTIIFIIAVVRATNPGVVLNVLLGEMPAASATDISTALAAPGGSMSSQTVTSSYVAEFAASDFFKWKDDDGQPLLASFNEQGIIIDVDTKIVSKDNGLLVYKKPAPAVSTPDTNASATPATDTSASSTPTTDTNASSVAQVVLRFPPVSFFNNNTDTMTVTLRIDTTTKDTDGIHQTNFILASNPDGTLGNIFTLQSVFNFTFTRVDNDLSFRYFDSKNSSQIAMIQLTNNIPDALEIVLTFSKDTVTAKAYEFGKSTVLSSGTATGLNMIAVGFNWLQIATFSKFRLYHFSINATNTTSKDEVFIVKSTNCYTGTVLEPGMAPREALASDNKLTKYNGKAILPAASGSLIVVPFGTTIIPNGHRLFTNTNKKVTSLGDVIKISIPFSNPVTSTRIVLCTVGDELTFDAVMDAMRSSTPRLGIDVGGAGMFQIMGGMSMFLSTIPLSYTKSTNQGMVNVIIDLCTQQVIVQLGEDKYTSSIKDAGLPTFNTMLIFGYSDGSFGDISVNKYLRMV